MVFTCNQLTDPKSNGINHCLLASDYFSTGYVFRCCRKQLSMAKCTRRVDILFYRLYLTQKLLQGTEKYKKLYEIIDEAVKKLEPEVGPLTSSPVKIGRGIVNRLSSGPEVQKLCGSALELLDSSLCEMMKPPSPSLIYQGNFISWSLYIIIIYYEGLTWLTDKLSWFFAWFIIYDV